MPLIIQPVISRKFSRKTYFQKTNYVVNNNSYFFPNHSLVAFRYFSTSRRNFQDQSGNAEHVIKSTGGHNIDAKETNFSDSNRDMVLEKPEAIVSSEHSTVINPIHADPINVHSSLDSAPVSALPSTSTENSNELILDFLPDRPAPLESGPLTEFLGMDPPLEALGLASWWPSGRMQYFMEYLHSGIGLDLPWWQTIIISELKY